LGVIADRLGRLGLQTRLVRSKDLGDTKLIVATDTSQVLIEVNAVFRGTLLPVERRRLSPRTAERFSVELELPILTPDELYASKLVAAMDRQHPRDLFDVWQLYESGGITDAMVECFVTYLAGHNRPTHEVVFGNNRDISIDYQGGFVGMTEEEVSLSMLLETRERLRQELPARMTRQQRQFLVGLAHARPDWSLLQCKHAAELPALRWKLSNLETFRQRRPADFKRQAQLLESRLG
jgi:hypothetical protein